MVFGVGQISSMDAGELGEVKDRLMPIMKNECGKNGVSMVFFMLTDIISESTELLSFGEGSERAVNESFGVVVQEGSSYLPGVVSRKKQLIPKFMQHFQNNN
jgi:manganese-dependent inorganic pyrophosphatase